MRELVDQRLNEELKVTVVRLGEGRDWSQASEDVPVESCPRGSFEKRGSCGLIENLDWPVMGKIPPNGIEEEVLLW